MEATTLEVTEGPPDYLVTGLAVGIPCAVIIILLILAIITMISVTLCNASSEGEIESMYMRRRFQGLSLEEQRKRKETAGRRNRFISRRRSSAAESRHSTAALSTSNSRNPRIRGSNPFGLQEWQLKLSGIDVAINDDGGGDTEETDIDEPPRSPMGAFNPLLLQDPNGDGDHTDYDPVPSRTEPQAADYIDGGVGIDSSSSSDSLNPYD